MEPGPPAPPFHRSLRSTPGRGAGPGEDAELEALLRSVSGRRLRCRVCRNAVTGEAQRIDVEGRHVHRRSNPAGFEFEFGCFAAASGAARVGEPTAEHSWFGGYSWVFSICRGCEAHLGWFFEGRNPAFHGLVLDRLEVEDGSAGDS